MTTRTQRNRLRNILLLGLAFSAHAAEQGDTTQITVSGTLVDAPVCTINGNNQIDVDFGDDVVINRIDGVSYKNTPIRFDLVCTSLAKQGLLVTFDGTPSPFNSQYIDTSVDGLGIRIFLDGVIPIPRGTGAAFSYQDIAGAHFSAAPVVQSGVTLSAQPFTGAGTVTLRYQ